MAAGAEEGIAGHAVVCQVTADADARITLAADIAGADGKVTGVLVAVGKFAVFVGCDVGDAFDGLTPAAGDARIIQRVFRPISPLRPFCPVNVGVIQPHHVAPCFAAVKVILHDITIVAFIEKKVVLYVELAGFPKREVVPFADGIVAGIGFAVAGYAIVGNFAVDAVYMPGYFADFAV